MLKTIKPNNPPININVPVGRRCTTSIASDLSEPISIFPEMPLLSSEALIYSPTNISSSRLRESICSGIVAAGSFLWRYSIRYTQAYTARVQEITELRDRAQRAKEKADMKQLREATQSGLSKINSSKGLKAMEELVYEYKELQHVLDHKKETDPLSFAHIPILAEETYRQGLSVLADVLEIAYVIHSSDKERLGKEKEKLEREIESLEADRTQEALVRIKKATVVSHKERLDMIKQQELRVDKLLYQCDRCEASLHRTRIELASLKTESSETSVSAVTETLQKTINQAKEVQEELKRLGY